MPVIAVGTVLTSIDDGRQREFGFLTCRSTPAGSTGVFRREYWSIPPGVLEYSAGSTGTFRQGAENKAGDAAVLAAHGMACTGRIGARSSGQCGFFGIFQQICISYSRKFDKFATISLSPKTKESLLTLAWREIALLRTISLSQKTKESLLTLAWREIALLRTILLSRCPQSVHIISRIPVCCNLIYQNNFYPYPLPRRK